MNFYSRGSICVILFYKIFCKYGSFSSAYMHFEYESMQQKKSIKGQVIAVHYSKYFSNRNSFETVLDMEKRRFCALCFLSAFLVIQVIFNFAHKDKRTLKNFIHLICVEPEFCDCYYMIFCHLNQAHFYSITEI